MDITCAEIVISSLSLPTLATLSLHSWSQHEHPHYVSCVATRHNKNWESGEGTHW